MKVTFWGTRGSIPTPAAAYETLKYGGNTPCVTVEHEDTLLILDAGSGIRSISFNRLYEKYKNVHILLTHLHMDHIQGLGFFGAFFRRDFKVTMWGPGGPSSLQARLNRYLSPPLFPVRIRDFVCDITVTETPMKPFELGPFKVKGTYICHPGPTLGYRISCNGKVLTYIPDHEPALADKHFPGDPDWTSGYDLVKEADVLIHDAQFTDDEYKNCIGWGHSSYTHAIQLAEMAGVKKLMPFHHDPSHTDDILDRIYTQYDCGNQAMEIEISREEASLEL